jgi:hypothetical protein
MALGYYLPSYFEIRIDTDQDLKSIAELPEREQGLYFHEYCHFLQDVTTTFGVLKTWNAYDRLRQLIYSVKQQTGEIEIPLKNDAQKQQQEYIDFLDRLVGNHGAGHPLIGNKYEISNIQLVDDKAIETIVPGLIAQHVHLNLHHSDIPVDKTYRFGERAISESMVYLVESKFYALPEPEKYPYKAASAVCEFVYPPFARNSELVFALCDVALMHPLPGWAFYKILSKIKDEGLTPAQGEEVIDIGFIFYRELGWDIKGQFEKAKEGIFHVTANLYAHEHFKPTLTWLHTVVENGYQLRMRYPYFFLGIYRDIVSLGQHMTLAWINLGGPHCINKVFQRNMKVPNGLEDIQDRIHPQHLRIAWQLNKYLLEGLVACKLQNVCSNSFPNVVDERCENHPWERVKDELGCPYAVAWVLYGFDQKKFVTQLHF